MSTEITFNGGPIGQPRISCVSRSFRSCMYVCMYVQYSIPRAV